MMVIGIKSGLSVRVLLSDDVNPFFPDEIGNVLFSFGRSRFKSLVTLKFLTKKEIFSLRDVGKFAKKCQEYDRCSRFSDHPGAPTLLSVP